MFVNVFIPHFNFIRHIAVYMYPWIAIVSYMHAS